MNVVFEPSTPKETPYFVFCWGESLAKNSVRFASDMASWVALAANALSRVGINLVRYLLKSKSSLTFATMQRSILVLAFEVSEI